jgi:hypothetical protein
MLTYISMLRTAEDGRLRLLPRYSAATELNAAIEGLFLLGGYLTRQRPVSETPTHRQVNWDR